MRNRYTETQDILELLREALAHRPSDIHINSGHPVLLEIHGELFRLTDHAIEWAEFDNVARVLRDKEGATSILSQGQDYDGAFVLMDHDGTRRRLRVNMTAITSIRAPQAGSIVMRPLDDIPPTAEEIGVPAELLKHCFPRKGAVYVIGPTGSGKTTLFGALVRHAADTGAIQGHMATYESPPEFDLERLSTGKLVITQVAIHSSQGLPSFADGGRNAVRRHPALILIGEVRDYETVQATVEASLTGHPVFATTHADNPAIAFQRLVTRYPPDQQRAGLYDLIMTTELIIAQRLVKAKAGGRVAVREWLVFDAAMRKKLLQKREIGDVVEALMGMIDTHGCSFSTYCASLVESGVITEEVAAQFRQ